MIFVSRQDAGLRPPKSVVAAQMDGVTFHYTGDHIGDISHDRCAGLWAGIQRHHMDANGWQDVAYNFAVCRHGVAFMGRGRNVANGANGTTVGNRSSNAICALLGDGDSFPMPCRRTMRELADEIGGRRRVHQEWVSTSCAGVEINEWKAAGCPVDELFVPAPPDPNAGLLVIPMTGD